MSFEKVQIGDCTLYRADCMEILPTLEPGSVDAVVTDPPYGHGNHDGDWNARLNKHRGIEDKPIANDGPEEMRLLVDKMLCQVTRILKPDCCCCCCCCGGGPRPTFAWIAERMDRKGLSFFHSVIWDKRNPGLGWRFRRQHEMVMVAHRTGGRLSWADENVAVPNVISIYPPRDRLHPNEKPVPLIRVFVENGCPEEGNVLDPFMGSGTTGVACIRTGRKFIGIEIDKGYFETACERIQTEWDLREGSGPLIRQSSIVNRQLPLEVPA